MSADLLRIYVYISVLHLHLLHPVTRGRCFYFHFKCLNKIPKFISKATVISFFKKRHIFLFSICIFSNIEIMKLNLDYFSTETKTNI